MLHAAAYPSLPASGVTHTVSGVFSPGLPSSQKEVVVVCGNQVILYRADVPASAEAGRGERAPLQFLMECPLYAPPLSVALCRPPGATVDALAMLFDDVHLSVVQLNARLWRLDTVALVRLDDRGLAMERCALPPILRADPTGAFLAVLAKRRELFVFPLLKKGVREGGDAARDSPVKPTPTAGSGRPAVKVSAMKKPVVKVALDAWGDDDDDDDDDDRDEKQEGEGDGDKNNRVNPPDKKGEEGGVGTTPTEGLEDEAAAAGTGLHSVPSGDALEVIAVGDILHVALNEIKDTLRNVRDLQFVETTTGEPLMVFLYEKQPTWAGRVKLVEWRSRSVEANMLTCSILWVKLTLGVSSTQPSRLLPIGDVDHLPFNTTHLTPLPSFANVPSAVLASGRNVLVHVSTKSGYGAYFNRHGQEEVQYARSSATAFHTVRWSDAVERKEEEGAEAWDLVRTNLNLANATILPLIAAEGGPSKESRSSSSYPQDDSRYLPQLLLFTEDAGTVVRLTIHTQGHAVSGMTASIILTGCFCSCYCEIGGGLFFLGSCRSDSRVVFVRSEKESGGEGNVERNGRIAEPLTVQQTIVGLAPIHDTDVLDATTKASGRQTANSEVDEKAKEEEDDDEWKELLGESVENSPYAELFHSVVLPPLRRCPPAQRQQAIDLVVCSGLGLSGALCVLRHSIRDNIIRREGVDAISAFFLESRRYRVGEGGTRKRSRSEVDGEEGRSLSNDASRVAHLLMTGNGFTILFAVQGDSVQQVRGTVLNIMSRTLFAAELVLSPGLLQVTDSEFRVASLDGKRTFKHVVFNTSVGLPIDCGPAKAAFCISPLDNSILHESLLVHFESGNLVHFALDDLKSTTTGRLVFGEVRAACLRPKRSELVAIQGMDLVFVSLADDKVLHRFPNFALLPLYSFENVEVPMAKLSARLNEEPLPTVTHMQVFEHPSPFSSPGGAVRGVECTLVLLISSGELLTYKVLPDDAHGPRRLLKSLHRFSNFKPEIELFETIAEKKKRLMEERLRAEQEAAQAHHCSERLIPFDNIGGYEGIYVCGEHPIFLIYDANRQELVASRHQTADAVRGFCPFRSRNVRDGYVYCSGGYVHFATMQLFGESLGHGWWMQRIPLGQTPHYVAYNPADSRCFVVTSTLQPFSPKRASFDVHLHINYDEEGNKTVTTEEPVTLPPLSAASGAPVPLNERYEVKLFNHHKSWRCEGSFLLEENEKALSVRCIEIPRDTSFDASPQSAMTAVCVLATAFPLGEHITTRGRLVLLVSRRFHGRSEISLLHSEPLTGPATAVAGIGGNIVVAVGGTIRVFRYDHLERKVETLAMLYAGAYVTHLSVVRDYLLFADLHHALALARFDAEGHTLTVLGRDPQGWPAAHTDVLYRGPALGLLAADDARRLVLFHYAPRLGEGARLREAALAAEAEYRVPGGSVRKTLRLRAPREPRPTTAHVLLTTLGAVGFLVPVNDGVHRTAGWAVRRLEAALAHPAGLPPRAFLGLPQDDAVRACRARERVLHAPLLDPLLAMDLRARKALAAAAQTQIDRVLNAAATIYVGTLLL